MIRRPPRSTLFPTRRSSDLHEANDVHLLRAQGGGHFTQHPRPIFDPYAKLLRLWVEDRPGMLGKVASDRKSTRLNSSHVRISYAVFCLKKKKHMNIIILLAI